MQWCNAIAKAGDCVLLPTGLRARKAQWEVPRKGTGEKYGFGKANVWYAGEDEDGLKEYLNRLVKQINEYAGENLIMQADDTY